MDIRKLVDHLHSFLQDFFPEKWSQLVFPLGSFVLLIGSTHGWLPPHHVLIDTQLQKQETDLWLNYSSHLVILASTVSILLVHFAYLASIVLWSLRVRNPIKQFRRWVIAPAGVGVATFLLMIFIVNDPRVSVAEPRSQVVNEIIHRFPSRLISLGTSFYITLIGIAVVSGATWAQKAGRIPLPVRFRDHLIGEAGENRSRRLGRNIFVMVIATAVLIAVPLNVLFLIVGTKLPLWSWRGTDIPTFDWASSTFYAAIATICAAAVLGRSRRSYLKRLFWPFKIQDAGLAFGIAIGVMVLPRILQGMSDQIHWGSGDELISFPYSWEELLIPKPFFWLLLVFVTALLQAAVLR